MLLPLHACVLNRYHDNPTVHPCGTVIVVCYCMCLLILKLVLRTFVPSVAVNHVLRLPRTVSYSDSYCHLLVLLLVVNTFGTISFCFLFVLRIADLGAHTSQLLPTHRLVRHTLRLAGVALCSGCSPVWCCVVMCLCVCLCLCLPSEGPWWSARRLLAQQPGSDGGTDQ